MIQIIPVGPANAARRVGTSGTPPALLTSVIAVIAHSGYRRQIWEELDALEVPPESVVTAP
jgi:hypothetical protein